MLWGGTQGACGMVEMLCLAVDPHMHKHNSCACRATNVTMDLSWVGIEPSAKVQVRDILKQQHIGTAQGSFTTFLQPHQSRYVRFTKTQEE